MATKVIQPIEIRVKPANGTVKEIRAIISEITKTGKVFIDFN